MQKTVSGVFDLDQIQKLTQFPEGASKNMKEACVHSLLHHKHASGIVMKVSDDSGVRYYSICWQSEGVDINAIKRAFGEKSEKATEVGAEAIACLMIIERTQYKFIERSRKGTGIDFWLSVEDNPENAPFQMRDARLEVSGILGKTPGNSVSSRVKTKLKQTAPSDGKLPAYVIVVEFSRPYAKMTRKRKITLKKMVLKQR